MANKKLTLKVKKLVPNAVVPSKAYDLDAGLDLTIIKKEVMSSNTIRACSTGIALEIPEGYYGQVKERGGFSLENTLTLKAGVVDAAYRGEVKVIFQNTGDYPVTIPAGTKVAQLVLHAVPMVDVEVVTELTESDRGTKGFGSSDKKV